MDEAKRNVPQARKFYCNGMQDHTFETEYDCIWIQWCIGYLTDDDLIQFLVNCKENGLRKPEGSDKTGLIFVKDNATQDEQFILDKADSSVMRTEEQIDAIFKYAGYKIIAKFTQEDMPEDLMPIICYTLKPDYS